MLLYLLLIPAALLAYVIAQGVRHGRRFTWIREEFDPAAHGLPPLDALDPSRSGPPAPGYLVKERQAVADAAWSGDWRAAAAYAEAPGTDWDARWDRLEVLQHIAAEDDAWLTRWRAERPDSCDAATLHASLLVHRAWAVRGSAYAHKVPDADMAQFHTLLPAAVKVAQDAAALDPAHPGPWIVMTTAARGIQYSAGEFQQIWQELCARAPHHAAAHWQAMQYWCAKWYGSDDTMLDFAASAVRYAPSGSLLAGLYLHALHELETRNGSALSVVSKDAGKELLTQVARALDEAPQEHEDLPRLRHLLAHFLGKAGLYEAALDQFRLIGPWCGAYPWRHKDKNPVEEFHKARGYAAWMVTKGPGATARPAAPAGVGAAGPGGSGTGTATGAAGKPGAH